MAYGLCTTAGYIKSDEIIVQLDAAIPIQNAHIQAIRDLEVSGCRYSNHDFDVLAAAHHAVGRTEIHSFEAKWVEVMNKKAAA